MTLIGATDYQSHSDLIDHEDARGTALSSARPAMAAEARSGSAAVDTANADYTQLVYRVQANEPEALTELYTLFSRGIKYYICRQLGRQELDDKVHDTFLIVVQTIQRGELRDPSRLMGFVRTIVRRQVAQYIEDTSQRRRDSMDADQGVNMLCPASTPEESAIQIQNATIMERILRSISQKDREILTRFYLREQKQEDICAEMGLSETQFRLLKSRAKARFGELGRKEMAKNALKSFFLRKNAAPAH